MHHPPTNLSQFESMKLRKRTTSKHSKTVIAINAKATAQSRKQYNDAWNRYRKIAEQSNRPLKSTPALKELITFSISGVQYYDYQTALLSLKPGTKVTLTGEPSNPHDPRAIRIDLLGIKLGYVPVKNEAQNLLWTYKEAGIKIHASIRAYNRNNPTWAMITVVCKVAKLLNSEELTNETF